MANYKFNEKHPSNQTSKLINIMDILIRRFNKISLVNNYLYLNIIPATNFKSTTLSYNYT